MNWERGFLRLWLLLSVLWLIGAGVVLFDDLAGSLRAWVELGVFLPNAPSAGGVGEVGSIDYLWRATVLGRIGALVTLLVGPPAASLLLGTALAWIFNRRRPDGPVGQSPALPQGGKGGCHKTMMGEEKGDGGRL